MAQSKETVSIEAVPVTPEDLRYSRHLHALLRDHIFMRLTASGFHVSPDVPKFQSALDKTSIADTAQRFLAGAHAFALGSTRGLGGSALQRFVGTHAVWSALVKDKLCAADASGLSTVVSLWERELGTYFKGALLPIWSGPPMDGHVVLLFEIRDGDLDGGTGTRTYYVAAVMVVINATEVMKPIHEALENTSTIPQCELLPRHYLLPPSGAAKAIQSSVDVTSELTLQFEEIEPFGRNVRLRYVTYCLLDDKALVVV